MSILIGGAAIAIYCLLVFYIGKNLHVTLQAFGMTRYTRTYWIVLYVISFAYFGSSIHELFKMIGSYWLFFFQYGLLLSLLGNFIYYVVRYRNKKVVGSTAVLTVIVLCFVGLYNAYTPVVHKTTMNVLKPMSESLRIVVASDFHLGVLSHKQHLQNFVNLSNEAKPDIVFLVGDLIDDDPKWFVEEGMAAILSQLETKHGVYAVLGNHEYYGGKINELVAEMEKANVHMLLDETINIHDMIYVTGQEDRTNEDRLPIEALAPDDHNLPWFVMNHTPDDLQAPEQAGVDAHFSGHTHRGQLWPNEWITNQIFEVDYGHEMKHDMHVLVSSGFGFWGPPMRIGSQSELWIVDVVNE